MADKTKKAPTLTQRVASLEETIKALELENSLLKDSVAKQSENLNKALHLVEAINNRQQTTQVHVGKLIGITSMAQTAAAELALSLQPKIPVFEVVVEVEKPDHEAFNAVSVIVVDDVIDIAVVGNEATQHMTQSQLAELRGKVIALNKPHGTVLYFAMQQVGERNMTLEESQQLIHGAE